MKNLMKMPKLSNEVLGEISDLCSLDKLALPNELKPMTLYVETNAEENNFKFREHPIPQEGLHTLKTLELQQQVSKFGRFSYKF